jgi:hypothetical protein
LGVVYSVVNLVGDLLHSRSSFGSNLLNGGSGLLSGLNGFLKLDMVPANWTLPSVNAMDHI